jgi:hypothetical protein
LYGGLVVTYISIAKLVIYFESRAEFYVISQSILPASLCGNARLYFQACKRIILLELGQANVFVVCVCIGADAHELAAAASLPSYNGGIVAAQ